MSKVHRHELSTVLEDYDDTRMGLDPYLMDDDDDLTFDFYFEFDDPFDDADYDWDTFDPIFYDFDDYVE